MSMRSEGPAMAKYHPQFFAANERRDCLVAIACCIWPIWFAGQRLLERSLCPRRTIMVTVSRR